MGTDDDDDDNDDIAVYDKVINYSGQMLVILLTSRIFLFSVRSFISLFILLISLLSLPSSL